ncbi:hypothetical protein [Teichococcus aestuarii]|uniref:hypothetical protein n=1 Tax=Teichococcus aestuarii TaxID=568898 RepID=UPI0036184E37
MALTLLINGRPLPAPDARGLTEGAGAVRAGQVFVMSDSLRDALLAAAAELRGITRSAAAPEEEKPRMRLKLQTPLHLLLERGHIRKMQHQAGHEIGRVMEAIAGGGPALAQNRYGETISGGQAPDIPVCLLPALNHRFLPWKRWAQEQRVSRRSPYTLFTVTAAVCFESYGPDQVAGALGLHRRTVIESIQRSLWRYCLIAGWESEEAA